MTDQTVTPIGEAIKGEESDMMHLQSIFAKAANAIVEASQLRKEVAELQRQMTGLNENVNSLRASNEQLVQELSAIRQEKTELHSKLWEAEDKISHFVSEAERAEKERQAHVQEIEGLKEQVAKSHGDFNFIHNALTDTEKELASLKEYVAGIKRAHKEFSAKLLEAHDVLSDVVHPREAQEVAQSHDWEAVKEAASPQEQPVGGQDHIQASGEEGQPRNEDGTFGPIPMAAKDFGDNWH